MEGGRTAQDTREHIPTLLLIRHGDTEKSQDKIVRGQTDDKLTAKGRAEAQQTAESIRSSGIELSALHTSDLQHARETAEIIGKHLGLQPVPSAGARTWKAGPTIEGHKVSDVEELLNHYRRNRHDAPPGGEPIADGFYARFEPYLFARLKEAEEAAKKGKAVGLVTHGRPLEAADHILAGEGPDETEPEYPKHGSITRIDKRQGKWRVDQKPFESATSSS